jgi:cytochrome c553
MRPLARTAALALASLALSGPASAGNPQIGKELAGKCKTCHGLDGIAKIPIAPNLAGENTIYIETQLKAFRSGKRVHEIMSVIAKDMTDEEIADVAAWYASIKVTVEMPN